MTYKEKVNRLLFIDGSWRGRMIPREREDVKSGSSVVMIRRDGIYGRGNDKVTYHRYKQGS